MYFGRKKREHYTQTVILDGSSNLKLFWKFLNVDGLGSRTVWLGLLIIFPRSCLDRFQKKEDAGSFSFSKESGE